MNTQTLTQPFIIANDDSLIIRSKWLSKLWPIKIKQKKGNAEAVLTALEKAKGILPADSLDGVAYANQIREEAEKHLEALHLSEADRKKLLKQAFHKACGVLPLSHPDGVTFENAIRQEAEEHWKQHQI